MFNISTRFIFIFGFVTGIIISLILHTLNNEIQTISNTKNIAYENWFKRKSSTRKNVAFDIIRYSQESHFSESELLFNSITVLCLIIVTKDSNLEAIQNTWGKGCNAVDSVDITKKQKKLIAVKQSTNEDSWIKLCAALKRVPDSFDWVLISYDDSFIVMENLRFFLAPLRATEKFYVGHPTKFWNIRYNMGAAGFVLSKGVIEELTKTKCESSIPLRNKEDFMLGNHLTKLNISVTEARDDQSFQLFQPYNLNKLMFSSESQHNKEAYRNMCCTDKLISFNALEGDKMYTYYYLLYILQVFKSGSLGNVPYVETVQEPYWKRFVREQNLSLELSAQEYYQAWENLIDSPLSFAAKMRREEYSEEIV